MVTPSTLIWQLTLPPPWELGADAVVLWAVDVDTRDDCGGSADKGLHHSSGPALHRVPHRLQPRGTRRQAWGMSRPGIPGSQAGRDCRGSASAARLMIVMFCAV